MGPTKNNMFFNFWKIFVCVTCIGGTVVSSKKFAFPITNKSYHVPVYATQGVQYSLYPAVPAVVPISNQVGAPTASIANVLIQQQAEYKPVQGGISALFPKSPVQKIKYRTVGHVVRKRPTPYVNYVFPATVKSYSVAQSPKISIVKSGLDATDGHYQQAAQSSVYQTAFVPAYNSLKAVEYPKKLIRVPSKNGQTYYRRVTGPVVHRHVLRLPKKTFVNGQTGEGHFHYYPTKHHSYAKAIPVIKYATPTVLTSTESPVFITTQPVQEASQSYAFNVASKVRFPSGQDQLLSGEQQTAPGEITRAFVRNSEINNYDATLPIKIPKKKPFQFEVSDLVKDSNGFHYEEENQSSQKTSDVQGSRLLQTSYTNGHSIAMIPVITKDSLITTSSPIDIYNMAGAAAYQNSNYLPDEDFDVSKTVKIPVAVIEGAHDPSGLGISGYSTARPNVEISDPSKKDFKPSKKVSDWIPMSKGVSHETTAATEVAKSSAGKYRHQVEEIISGKIPREYSPNLSGLRLGHGSTGTDPVIVQGDENDDGDDDLDDGRSDERNIGTENNVYANGGSLQNGRRQNVIVGYVDSVPSTASDSTYNHVVSSVIKFSR